MGGGRGSAGRGLYLGGGGANREQRGRREDNGRLGQFKERSGREGDLGTWMEGEVKRREK